ncbi:MAG: NAD(P)/FAD-dependent oxidoreductase [Bacteroidota bacterium]|nr:NAD(P)/FAD-dependent oxidoreductase [Bacteroidota bacterium]
MNDRYDVVVIGAGPAGSVAALGIAREGFSVLLLEKDPQVGIPVRCGEAVSARSLEALTDVDPHWITATIRRFRLVAPSGAMVEPDIGGHGYILDRVRFDGDLARAAVDAGAVLLTDAYAYGLVTGANGFEGVLYEHEGECRRVSARIIIGADGVESRVGRWAGIETAATLRDMECCTQMTLSNIDTARDTCTFYFGSAIAPEGYLWVFPKGDRQANVGIGISGTAAQKRRPISFLREFVSSHFPGAVVSRVVAGGDPCAETLRRITAQNVVLVGDAARQVNPLSGGGITSGMQAAEMAARAVVRALREKRPSRLSEYPREWRRKIGAKHRTYYRMKEVVRRFPDAALDDIAERVLRLPPEKRTLWGVFKTALVHHPSLLWEMVRTFHISLSD